MANQSLYPDGLQHQNDSEYRCGNRRWGLGIAGNGHVGAVIKLSDFALDRSLGNSHGPAARLGYSLTIFLSVAYRNEMGADKTIDRAEVERAAVTCPSAGTIAGAANYASTKTAYLISTLKSVLSGWL